MINLAVNARDAMPAGGRLSIETGNAYLDRDYTAAHPEVEPGQYVLLAVSDTGTGMSVETAARAFEPFFTTKPVGEGTGLGLSQVYGFVGQSNGHVTLDSEPGAGTTVNIYLPRLMGVQETAVRETVAEVTSMQATLLVVEDDGDVRKYIVSALTGLGYHVLGAGEASAALSIVECHPEVKLLLTDVGLPGLNGRQLAEEASRRSPEINVLFISGYARQAIEHDCILDNGVELLSKPFTMESLARKVAQMLRHAHLPEAFPGPIAPGPRLGAHG